MSPMRALWLNVGRTSAEGVFVFFRISFGYLLDTVKILLKIITYTFPLTCPPPSYYPAYAFRFPPWTGNVSMMYPSNRTVTSNSPLILMTKVSNVCLRTYVPYAFPLIKWRQDVGRDFFSNFLWISLTIKILLKTITYIFPLMCPPPSYYPNYAFRFPRWTGNVSM